MSAYEEKLRIIQCQSAATHEAESKMFIFGHHSCLKVETETIQLVSLIKQVRTGLISYCGAVLVQIKQALLMPFEILISV